MTKLSFFLVGLAMFAGTALAGVDVGADPPEIEGREYLNIEPVKLADLRGRVVLVQIFRVGSQPCAEQAKHLQDLQQKYEGRGLTVLAVTNEDRKPVEEFLGKNKGSYPVVLEKSDSAANYGLAKGFPTTILISADGKIAWKGNWADKSEDKILTLLPKARQIPRLPARFAEAGAHAEAGRLFDARKPIALELLNGTASDVEKPLLKRMLEWIDAKLMEALTKAVEDANAHKYYEADVVLERLATEGAHLDVGRRAAEARRQLFSDPARKREVDAGRALAEAREKAKDQKPAKAISLYKAVIAKFKDTAAAKEAADLVAELEKK